jgi:hypothetical protein
MRRKRGDSAPKRRRLRGITGSYRTYLRKMRSYSNYRESYRSLSSLEVEVELLWVLG